MPSNHHLQLDVVSAEAMLLSETVQRVMVTAESGGLGIEPGHAPLIAPMKPGQIRLTQLDGEVRQFYVSGGVVEVQPHHVTILADHAVRAEDLDEAAALEAQADAQRLLDSAKADVDYSHALASLAQAAAQLQLIRQLKERRS